MFDPNATGVLYVVGFVLVLCGYIATTRLPFRIKMLIYAAIALRFVGAVGRESIAADANTYLRWGWRYAEHFMRFDFSPLFDPMLWRGSTWLGTNFVGYPVGFVMSLIGPSRMGTFYAFALLGFAGIFCFALAFKRAFPQIPYRPYWMWVFLLPSLWFWPSSVGKEAIMIFGLGLATLGFVGKHGKMNWLVLGLGLAVTFMIRPQVTAVFVFAIALSAWLDFQTWTPRKVIQGVGVIAIGLLGMWFAMATTLEGDVDLESVQAYIDENASRNQGGGSSIEGVGSNPANIPLAMTNVLFRPFPWEAHNAAALLSALEVLLMWGIVFIRRHRFRAVIKHWRKDRVLRFALPFALLYVIALGMNLSNLGLMSRQRVLVFPFIFLVVEAGAQWLQRRRPVPPVGVRQPPRVPPRMREARPAVPV